MARGMFNWTRQVACCFAWRLKERSLWFPWGFCRQYCSWRYSALALLNFHAMHSHHRFKRHLLLVFHQAPPIDVTMHQRTHWRRAHVRFHSNQIRFQVNKQMNIEKLICEWFQDSTRCKRTNETRKKRQQEKYRIEYRIASPKIAWKEFRRKISQLQIKVEDFY